MIKVNTKMIIKSFHKDLGLFFVALFILVLLLMPAGKLTAGIAVECNPETEDPCISTDGSILRCVPKGECCWGTCSDGSCRGNDLCCPEDRRCVVDNGPGVPSSTYCVSPDDCCEQVQNNYTPGERKCVNEDPPRCIERGSGECCEGEELCDDEANTCIDPEKSCCPGERKCEESGPGGRPICVDGDTGCCPNDELCADGVTCVCSGPGCPYNRRCCPGERVCYGDGASEDRCVAECQPCSSDWKICVRNGRCVEIPQNDCCEECVEGEQECLKGQCKDILVDTDPDNDPSIPGAIYNKHTKNFTDSDWFAANNPPSGPSYIIRQHRVRRNLDAGRYETYYEDTYCPTGTFVHGTAKAPNGLLIAVCGVWKCSDPDCQGPEEDPCRGHLYKSTSASAYFQLANGEKKYSAVLPDRCDGLNIWEARCVSDNNGGMIAVPYVRSCPNDGRGCSDGACNP